VNNLVVVQTASCGDVSVDLLSTCIDLYAGITTGAYSMMTPTNGCGNKDLRSHICQISPKSLRLNVKCNNDYSFRNDESLRVVYCTC